MASNYGTPTQSANPAARMTAGQKVVNNAQVIANRKVLGNQKVSNATGQAAYKIEQGMPVKQAKYHQ